MKALVWEAPRTLHVREVPEPTPAPGEVVITVDCAGICGSELGGYLGHNALRVPPLVMGHEFAGTITAVADDVPGAFPTLAIGARVTANPMTWCNQCIFCARGQQQLCRNRKLVGAHRPGAYAHQVAVPAHVVVPLPDNLPFRLAALAEPTAVALRIATHAGNVDGATVLIAGAGPIGLLAIQTLRLAGATTLFVTDLDPARRAMAADLGAIVLDPRETNVPATVRDATDGLGAGVAVDAVGATPTRADCVASVISGGTLVLSGLHEETGPMPAAEIIRREITVKGSFCYAPSDIVDSLPLLADGRIRLDPWIVDAPLEDGGKWFDRLIDAPGDVAKVLLRP
jgi:threonine dehydrogenase-like Zn-dependent dehydrogenase